MRMKKKSEQGLLSLEASIVVTLFIFLMLFMYSFFVVFEARNSMGHALLATTNSLALDAYENSQLGDNESLYSLLRSIYGSINNDKDDFTDYRKWYEDSTTTNADGTTSLSGAFSDVLKTRFLAYLSGGKEEDAKKVLDSYHIRDGLEGLDFSGSYVDEKNRLHVSLRYTIDYEFRVFNLSGLKMEQKACSKLWK